MPGGAHSGDLGHGRSQGRGPEWDNGNGASHLSPLLEHHRRASGGRSRVCLRAEFVLKRFIISLTGRFPASVLVNNCSQLNVRKICIAGVQGVGGHEENFLPAHAWCGDTTGVAWLWHMAQGWQRGGMGQCLQRVPHPKPSAWALPCCVRPDRCFVPFPFILFHHFEAFRPCLAARPMHHLLKKHFSLDPDARSHPTWAEATQLVAYVTSGAFSERRGPEPRLSVRQLEKQPKGRKKGAFCHPHLHRSLKLPKCGVFGGGALKPPREHGEGGRWGTAPFSKANNHSLG